MWWRHCGDERRPALSTCRNGKSRQGRQWHHGRLEHGLIRSCTLTRGVASLQWTPTRGVANWAGGLQRLLFPILQACSAYCVVCLSHVLWLFMYYSNKSFVFWIGMLIDMQRLLTSKEFWSGPSDLLNALQRTAVHLEHAQKNSVMQQAWQSIQAPTVGCQPINSRLSTLKRHRHCQPINSRLSTLKRHRINSSVNSWKSTRLSSHGYQLMKTLSCGWCSNNRRPDLDFGRKIHI